jgi:hypothetical protein
MIGDRSVVAVGRVVHTGSSGPDQGGRLFLAGIEFIDVSESSQAIINDFIELMRLAEFKIGAAEKPATREPGQIELVFGPGSGVSTPRPPNT